MPSLAVLRDLNTLRLGDSPIPESISPLQSLKLIELDFSGDSWLRIDMVEEVAKMKYLKTFRMGHLEHSDCDCYAVAP